MRCRDTPGRFQPYRERGHAGNRLQRVLRRDEPPNLVEVEVFERQKAEVQMAAMGRIERAAQQPDAAMPPRRRPSLRGGAQGRT
jgi:hypothetical protein